MHIYLNSCRFYKIWDGYLYDADFSFLIMDKQTLVQRELEDIVATNVSLNNLDPEVTHILSVANNHKTIDLSSRLANYMTLLTGKPHKSIEILEFVPKEDHGGLYVTVNPKVNPELNEGRYHLSPDEFATAISHSRGIKDIVETLKRTQGEVLLHLYKNVPELNLPQTVVLGPDPYLVDMFDDKTRQRAHVVEPLDLPVPEYYLCADRSELLENYGSYFSNRPAFVMCSHSSSGSGTESVGSVEDILSSKKIHEGDHFILSELLDVALSPSTLGIATSNEVYVCGLSDQLLDGVTYRGNISPSMASQNQQDQMVDLTKQIGEHMASYGYRGPFGVDFMIDQNGKVYFTEINPRVIGATPELDEAHRYANPDLPSIPYMIYSAVTKDTLGFDTSTAVLPQTKWISRSIKVPGGYTSISAPTLDPSVKILDHPGPGVYYETSGVLCRLVSRGLDLSRREMINLIDSSESSIYHD